MNLILKKRKKSINYWPIFPIFIFLSSTIIILKYDLLSKVISQWPMLITMFFGSFIAGSTAEGGAAIAFPVMTLILNISPMIARDFGLCIQSIGMTSASIFIHSNNIKIIKNIIPITIIGSSLGLFIGFKYISGAIQPVYIKFFFTGLWQAFAYGLWKVYSQNRSTKYNNIHLNNIILIKLFFLGLIGGIISSLLGSGIDLLIFVYLTLVFNVPIKTATPTSVTLMAITSIIGVFQKIFIFNDLSLQVIPMVLMCSYVVVFGAPLGSFIAKKVSSKNLKLFLFISITAQSIWAFIILPITINSIFVYFSIFFLITLLIKIFLKKS